MGFGDWISQSLGSQSHHNPIHSHIHNGNDECLPVSCRIAWKGQERMMELSSCTITKAFVCVCGGGDQALDIMGQDVAESMHKKSEPQV